ncbi:MAG: hypothetical protein AAF682_15640 [Planctomycetota bacterium]
MKLLPLLVLSPLLSACAAAPAPAPVPIEVPHFAADAPEVREAGFVGQTLRLRKTVGANEYILMAFRVGEVVTLGAMLQGSFDGDVRFAVGAAELVLPFPDESPGRESPARVARGPAGHAPIVGQRASFRGTRWINVDLDASLWFPEPGTPVQLTFLPYSGENVALPEEGAPYAVAFVPQP